mmetsp:Transcript_22940/g.56995  ORF Transcript_22940/g.56995 Transcript_22940/m.56995 type:complete len:217 (+) Transcript_22940:765-1415(+)
MRKIIASSTRNSSSFSIRLTVSALARAYKNDTLSSSSSLVSAPTWSSSSAFLCLKCSFSISRPTAFSFWLFRHFMLIILFFSSLLAFLSSLVFATPPGAGLVLCSLPDDRSLPPMDFSRGSGVDIPDDASDPPVPPVPIPLPPRGSPRREASRRLRRNCPRFPAEQNGPRFPPESPHAGVSCSEKSYALSLGGAGEKPAAAGCAGSSRGLGSFFAG